MNLQFTQEELDFQKEVKDWIKENYPSDMKERYVNSPNGHLTKEEHVQWQQALFSKGWAGINWPKENGGASFSASQKYIFSKEMAAARAPSHHHLRPYPHAPVRSPNPHGHRHLQWPCLLYRP